MNTVFIRLKFRESQDAAFRWMHEPITKKSSASNDACFLAQIYVAYHLTISLPRLDPTNQTWGNIKKNFVSCQLWRLEIFLFFLFCSTIRRPEPFIRNLVHFQTKVDFTYTDSRIKELMDDELFYVYFGYSDDIVDLLEDKYEIDLMIPIKIKINDFNFFHRDLKAFIESKIDWIL